MTDAKETTAAVQRVLNDGVAAVFVDESKSALQKFCWLKRMEDAIKQLQTALVKDANADFDRLRLESPKVTRWPVEGFAVLTNNAASGSWLLPKPILEKQAELDIAFDTFKKTHPEMYTAGVLDPHRNALFRVSIMK